MISLYKRIDYLIIMYKCNEEGRIMSEKENDTKVQNDTKELLDPTNTLQQSTRKENTAPKIGEDKKTEDTKAKEDKDYEQVVARCEEGIAVFVACHPGPGRRGALHSNGVLQAQPRRCHRRGCSFPLVFLPLRDLLRFGALPPTAREYI